MKFRLKENINLKYSLDGGQAFRWWDYKNTYRGVVGNNVYQLVNNKSSLNIGILNQTDDVHKAKDSIYKYLSIGLNMEDFINSWSDDPCIGPSIRGYEGLRILRQDPWECLFSFICSSTNNASRIKLNVTDVSRHLGKRIHVGINDYSFPEPEECYNAGENTFREIGLGFRSKYVVDASKKILDNIINLQDLRTMEYLEAREKLMLINGVGEKIADCVLAFSLDKKESFPVDRHILRALIKWYGLPESTNPAEASKWARKRFGKYSSLANQYIFHRERLSSRYRMWGDKHKYLVIKEDE